jgi:amino acid adenylation domain-containing protein
MATLHGLFEQQVTETPHATALVEGDKSITSGELNALANQFAHYLIAQGVKPNEVVAIGLTHSIELIVAILGILKAGCTYITLDLNWPEQRISYILGDSRAVLLVTTNSVAKRLLSSTCLLPVFYSDRQWSDLANDSSSNPELFVPTETIAYIVYTSGSTGKPKGVLGPHRGMINRLEWSWPAFPFQAHERCVAKTTLGFVDSVAEIFAPICKGIPLYLMGVEPAKQSPENFVSLLAEARVTRIILVPSLLNTLLTLFPDLSTKLPDLRHWEISGEAVTATLAKRFLATYPSHNAKLLNYYGSSEVIDATFHQIIEDDLSLTCSMPIGKCIPHMKYYLLDDQMQSVTVAREKGNLYLAGGNLAVGYLNQPELTAKAFLPNPFPEDAALYPMIYKMGDIGSFSEDGVLFYHGRSDHQVKINGIRVELGEIEAALLRCRGVHLSAVRYWQSNNSQHGLLVAYISYKSTEAGDRMSTEAIQERLKEELPPYMIPAQIVVLDPMPLNANGKVDRLALTQPTTPVANSPAAEGNLPETAFEKELLSLFQVELGEEFPIDIHMSFTAMGLSSLLFALIRAQIQKQYSMELTLREMIQAENIKKLSNFLFSSDAGEDSDKENIPFPKNNQAKLKKNNSLSSDIIIQESPIKNCTLVDLATKGSLLNIPFYDCKTGISYSLFTQDHFESALQLAAEVFTVSEPLCSHLHMTVEEFKAIYSVYFAQAIEEKLSVVATKNNNNQVIAVTIGVDRYGKGIIPDIENIPSLVMKEKLRPMYEITDSVYLGERNIINSDQPGQVVTQLITAVDPDCMGAEIGLTIEKYSASLAIQKGFQMIVSELSSPLSQSLAKTLGFTLHPLCCYETYKDTKDQLPFQGLPGGLQLATLALPSLQ